MDLAAALRGSSAPDEVLRRQCLLDLRHVDLDGAERTGQLVADERVADDLLAIFGRLFDLGFPIAQIVPIVAFDWDDDASMAANNTSCFNHRLIAGTDRMSEHSWGRAVDINPLLNPYGPDPATWLPPNGVYDLAAPGTVGPDVADPAGRAVIAVFAEFGWEWLGDDAIVDRHHFQKPQRPGPHGE